MTPIRAFPPFSLLLLYLALASHPTQADGPISIQSEPAFGSARPCGQNCLYCGQYWLVNCDATPLLDVLSCVDLDSCYCRTDLQSSASSYLTSCIASGCSGNTVDIATGISLYNGYCHIDGATLDNYPTPTGAATVVETSALSAAPGNSPIVVVYSTVTLPAAPGTTPTVVVYSTVISATSTVLSLTSKWFLGAAVAVAAVFASGVELFGA
jgi:hypothetical protein